MSTNIGTKVLLDGVTANGAGPAVELRSKDAGIVIWGIGTATVTIQVSSDGTNWVTSGLAPSSDAGLRLPGAFKYVRCNVTGYSAGTIYAHVCEVS